MNTNLKGKHLITFDTWDSGEIQTVLEAAKTLKVARATGSTPCLLDRKTLFMIFFEQSTRTRNSMEASMTQLGGHAHDLTPDKMQLSHGESPKDTANVLSRMGEGIAIRNCFYGIGNTYLEEVACESSVPVISMQDDIYHPLQAIADLMTMQEHLGQNLKGLKVAVSWAYATSHAKPLSVPQSQILMFPRFGMDVRVAHPKEFPLQNDVVARAQRNAEAAGGSVKFCDSMSEALDDADVVIPKNWGGFAHYENGDDGFVDDEEHRNDMKANLEKHQDWICDGKVFSLTAKGCKVMHALPADRGKEVTDEVLDGPGSIIYDEAENRLHTSRSILALTMGG